MPELIHRDERVAECWYAANVPDDDASPHAKVISSEGRQIADAGDLLWFAIDPGHGVVASPGVDEILDVGMTMP